jgi:carboxymethylenebutenolidase
MMRATERHLTFTSGGKTIKVDAFGPEDVRRPAVIMLHGADGLGANRQYVDGARDMARAGYHVYLAHYLDRTQERRASFSTLFQNFQPWMETVQDSVAWVSGQPETEAGPIGVIGISLGAALGLAVASADRFPRGPSRPMRICRRPWCFMAWRIRSCRSPMPMRSRLC